MKHRVEELPKGRFEKWGFGLARVRNDEWQPRVNAVQTALKLIDKEIAPAKSPAVINSLEIVKGLFTRQYLTDQFDWFTTARFTGYPSPQLAKKISQGFAKVRGSILNDDRRGFDEGLNALKALFVDEMLEGYLDMAVRAKYPPEEKGFAYIVFSTSEKQALAIGATEGHVDQVLSGLDKDYKGHDPYGVAAAYLVNDPQRSAELLQKAFYRHYIDGGFYRLGLKEARERMEEVLYAAHEIVASPWHAEGEEEELVQSAPKVAAA